MNYQKMYAILCAGISEAIDMMDNAEYKEARDRLQDALYDAEDYYVDSSTQTLTEKP